ncbi:MAG: ring-cleaving dioxygenase, partial [Mesorhizobium sp.]
AKGDVPSDEAIRGFHSVALRLKDGGATEELLKFMGYEEVDTFGTVKRLAVKNGNGANIVDIESLPGAAFADLGAGSV